MAAVAQKTLQNGTLKDLLFGQRKSDTPTHSLESWNPDAGLVAEFRVSDCLPTDMVILLGCPPKQKYGTIVGPCSSVACTWCPDPG